jgi:GNAT superfamily N-acetyltransferase
LIIHRSMIDQPLLKSSKMSKISVAPATSDDLSTVVSILSEAANWLEQKNMPLWTKELISPEIVSQDIASGLFYIATLEGLAAGVFMLQTEDLLFWPDVPSGSSLFIHRLAVKRCWAGKSLSSAMMQWAVQECQNLGKQYLRLDCVADRPRLRSVYENFGFQYHSDRQVGAYFVARYEYKVVGQ